MAVNESDTLIHTKDENGNTTIHYPITKSDNVTLLTGTATELGLEDGASVDAAVLKLKSEVSGISSQAVSNPNLLDNWYFGNPVNQNGKAEYTGDGYAIDRWKIQWSGNVIVHNGYLELTDSTTFDQKRETPLITGVYTASALKNDGTLDFVTFDFKGEPIGAWSQSGKLNFSVYTNYIRLYTAGTNEIIAVKLELGSAQTLAHQENGVWVLNEIPNYAEQMAICSQYNPTTGEYIGGLVTSSILMAFSINESGGLRITYDDGQ